MDCFALLAMTRGIVLILAGWNALQTGALDEQAWSDAMPSLQQIAKPIARAISIYRRVARRELNDDVRREVARHIKKLAEQGVEDPNSLTAHGLSYLSRRDAALRKPR